MKTAMQEMFSQLEIDQPQLFNVYTTEGKDFINSYIKFIEMEKQQIETAFFYGKDLNRNGTEYYNETFKKQ
jgi:hypothetical protein